MRNNDPIVLTPLGAQNASFLSSPMPLDKYDSCSIQCTITSPSSLAGSAFAQGSVDGIDYSDLEGATLNLTSTSPLLFVLSDIGSLRFVRLRVNISAGSADFAIIAGAS